MDFSEVIERRRSIRHYQQTPIPPEALGRLYRALQAAPSTGNRQERAFHFVNDPEKRRQIVTRACNGQLFILEAPVIVVAACKQGHLIDAVIGLDHLILAATNEGLGTCWISWFQQDIVKEVLKIPDSQEAPVLVPIGYAAETPEPRSRKSLQELIIIE